MIKKKKTVLGHTNTIAGDYHVLRVLVEYNFLGKKVYSKRIDEIRQGSYSEQMSF